MITDTERREVARRLRDSAEERMAATGRGNGNSWGWLYRSIFGRYIGTEKGAKGHYVEVAHRLADLIEPDEPPYNLYTLYEAVFHRSPRCWECIEDDEVEELIEALLDICNAPGHECIQRPLPSEPKVKCVAEVKIDGERLEELAHDAAVELTGIDRDALLALAVNLDARATELLKVNDLDQSRQRRSARLAHATDLMAACSRIREALGVQDV